jgi:hypothetical protein
MITGILGKLKGWQDLGGGDTMISGLGSVSNIMNIFDITKMVPPYFLQIAIGIYIIEIIFILTSTLVVIDSGEDKLKSTNEIGKNLIRGGILYLVVAFLAMISLSILAGVAFGGLVG